MNLPDGYFLQNGKYQLTHTIGQGGFGITYLGVWNTVVKGGLGAMRTKVPVCIKEYFFKDYCYREKNSCAVKVHSATGERLFDKFKEKLIKEANILSEVHHPHIVNVLEVFEENNTAYIIMEYIKGCSLKYMLDKEGVLSENKLLRYVHQIGNALDFVHDKNIVHLDIKPSNILIDKDDNARLIDFGVSKRYDLDEQITSTTTLTLSKGFASIEQYDDEGTQTFSPCPDIYSLGATMYNLLTGVIPVESILRATKSMLPPSSYNANITKKTEKAILKAMEVKPEDRYQAVKELLASLDIPPYEFSENNLIETKHTAEDEFTEVLNGRSPLKPGSDDDETILRQPVSVNGKPQGNVSNPKRKIEKRILLSVVILSFAFLGYAVYSYFTDAVSQRFISGISMPGEKDTVL
ncbi:MAG: serine/threonine protein kinase, partial [Tannerella sp.]|nr:serine/threonine protein kinase [Tannerella sp.]